MRFNVRVTNLKTGRVDYHRELSRDDIYQISSCSRFKVEILSEDYAIEDDTRY